jgi:hypothetical protein
MEGHAAYIFRVKMKAAWPFKMLISYHTAQCHNMNIHYQVWHPVAWFSEHNDES